MNALMQVITWIFLALMSLMLAFRFLSTLFLKAGKWFRWEDLLIVIAYATAVGESVLFLIPSSSAFGKEMSTVAQYELTSSTKIQYAANLLFIIAVGFSKLSVCMSLFALSPDRIHRRLTVGVFLIIIMWILTSVFVTAFQCGSHKAWDKIKKSCIDQNAFLDYVGISNILSDVALIAVPIVIVYPLKMAFKTRATIIAAIIPSIIQLIYLPRLFEPDYTLKAVPFYLATQATLFASISAACIVYFWPFLRSLQSGLVSANNKSFTSQYVLSRLPKPQERISKHAALDVRSVMSSARDTRSYVQITTEHHVDSS
ncbi:hypothetical protein EKO27_g9967 [Xylaria grammica]|uniref:Rhodopsin domain-containing protein n=1 Tax=Xylaria grammica TaxID=363999 RepID=A0A439CSH1_9PEZI|nr:hypothetical protein EKO27_g9967 [Xylaria grammica]